MHYENHGNDKPVVDGPLPPELAHTPKINLRDVPDEAYFDGRIAKLASEALHELKSQLFFLAAGFWKPHSPFNAPKKYWDLYEDVEILSPDPAAAPRGVPPLALHDSREILGAFRNRPGGRPTDAETRKLRRGYYANISYLDAQVGKVLDALEREGLADKTIVVFWSDHGYHLGEQTLWAKTSNFELDARVPLMIAAPGKSQATGGKATGALVELLDLYPTLADLCGLQPPGDLGGKSLRPLLEGTAETVKHAALTQHTRPAYPSAEEPLEAMGYSLRTERFRYVEWRSVEDGSIVAQELYDHQQDPRETVNLAADAEKGAERQSQLAQLSAELKAIAPPRAIAIE
jgi:iduronate 2-sulfatase